MSAYVRVRDWRPSDEGERNLVLQSWLRSSLRSRLAEAMPKEAYTLGHAEVIEGIALGGGARVRIAQPEATLGEIAGWLAYEGDVLHYVYVKNVFRRMGVARRLLVDAGPLAWASHWTRRAEECGRIFRHLRFDPYRALRALPRSA